MGYEALSIFDIQSEPCPISPFLSWSLFLSLRLPPPAIPSNPVPSQGSPTPLKRQLLALDLVSTGIPSGHTLLFSMWLQKLLLKVFRIQRDGCTKGRIPRRRGTPIIDLFYILHSPSKSSTCQETTGLPIAARSWISIFSLHSTVFFM